MTPRDRLTIGSMVTVVVLVLAVLFILNRGHRELTDARRDAENARLALAQQIVATSDTRRQLQGTVADLLAQNAELAAAVEEAKRAAPDARPIGTASLSTGTIKVQKPVAQAHAPVTPTAPPPPAAACLLTDMDEVSLHVDQVVLETKEGNKLLAGVASAFRETPPRQLLAEGRFRSALSETSTLAPPPEPRWGAELLGQCQRDGCGLGAGVLLPPWPALGLRFEARAGFLLGPAPSATAGLGVRW